MFNIHIILLQRSKRLKIVARILKNTLKKASTQKIGLTSLSAFSCILQRKPSGRWFPFSFRVYFHMSNPPRHSIGDLPLPKNSLGKMKKRLIVICCHSTLKFCDIACKNYIIERMKSFKKHIYLYYLDSCFVS